MSSTESNDQHPPGKSDIPIINKVPAGYPTDFTDLDYPPSIADEYVRCPDIQDPQAFAARVVGDSMEPDYHEGDIVIFAPNTPAESGQDCFVRLDTGETTFKRVYQDDPATLRLQPLNEKYPANIVPRREVTGLWPAVVRIERLDERQPK
jgi:phage repressor protein C with HTH and peptisase S24 domain